MPKKRWLFFLLLFFLLGCAQQQIPCMLEQKEYSCQSFEIGNTSFENESIAIRAISYQSENLTITGFLAEPKEQGKFPLIIYAHGGRDGVIGTDKNWLSWLAEEGYVVLASSYRGEAGSEGSVEIAKGETTDVLNLMECGKQLGNVDPEKIGAIGFSHGGGIALQSLELSKDIDVGVEFWGAINVLKIFETADREGQLKDWFTLVEAPEDEEALFRTLVSRSAFFCVQNIYAPLQIHHGEIDDNIHYVHALDLKAELEKYGKEYELNSYPTIGHRFEDAEGNVNKEVEQQAFQKTLYWLNKYLK